MREMKDSGVAWIGEIPKEWNTIPTKHLFKIESGATPKSENEAYFDGNIPWITPADYKTEDVFVSGGRRNISQLGYESCSTTLIPAGSLIFSKRAPIGAVAISAAELCTNQGCLSCVAKTSDNIKYYYYTMSICTEQYNLLGSGTTFKEISAVNFANFALVHPPLPEQRRIAACLDAACSKVDALIANQQAQIEKLKAYKQSLITEVVTHGLNPDAPMKDSGVEWIGQVPEGWEVIRIPYILDRAHPYPIGDGDHGLIGPDDYQDDGIPYIRVQNLGWATELQLDNLVYISDELNQKIKNSTLRPNDILFAKTGATIGKTGMVPLDMPIANTTSHVGKLTVNDKYNPRFVFYVLSSYIGYRQFWSIACQKTTRPELAINEIKAIRILMPSSRNEQDKIVEVLDEKLIKADKLIAIKQQKIDKLTEYKKSLIYEYVTGKKEA